MRIHAYAYKLAASNTCSCRWSSTTAGTCQCQQHPDLTRLSTQFSRLPARVQFTWATWVTRNVWIVTGERGTVAHMHPDTYVPLSLGSFRPVVGTATHGMGVSQALAIVYLTQQVAKTYRIWIWCGRVPVLTPSRRSRRGQAARGVTEDLAVIRVCSSKVGQEHACLLCACRADDIPYLTSVPGAQPVPTEIYIPRRRPIQ